MIITVLKHRTCCWLWSAALLLASSLVPQAGTLAGRVSDPNWYARYQGNPFGVGYYEYAVNANGLNLSATGGADDTDVFGAFSMPNLPAGQYTLVSWDVWWRSAYAFNVTVPASGSALNVDLRLSATMWGYPAFWEERGYYEFGQTFVATGPVTMIYLRAALGTSYTLTVHDGGPPGPQIGQSRSFSGAGDKRLIYGYGQMPTQAARTYYVRVRTSAPSVGGVLRQMDPRPDYSDPMPGGCLWLGDGTTLTAYPDRDLGLIIMSDDDGLITGLFARQSGNNFTGVNSVGQTFVARGVGLISAAFWLADPAGPTYVVRVMEGGPGGAQVGNSKRGRPARLTADPEMLVAWAPGECPLVPGQTYYAEVTRDGGAVFNSVYVNTSNPFAFGDAYRNGVAVPGTDLAGTLMEEQSPGSAARPRVRIVQDPAITEAERGAEQVVIRWVTDVPSDSSVEYAEETPPYQVTNNAPALVTQHAVTLEGLSPHTLYHFRVRSEAEGHRPAISRDVVFCSRPASPNLLANPGFEEGTGSSPRGVIPGWTVGGLDIKASNGTWFNSLPPRSGVWFLQGAVNGGESDGYASQRVSGVTPGQEYRFSAWTMTWPLENSTTKYDVWNDPGRLIWMQLGVDPTGGTDRNATTVEWTPRLYSHTRYSNPAKTVRATATAITVFVRMAGRGGQWHLYGLDDCVLTPTEVSPTRTEPFEFMPAWTSSYDAPDGSAAQITLSPAGQPGPSLQVVRFSPGTSARVKEFQIEPDRAYAISVYALSLASSALYESACAFRLGQFTAQSFVDETHLWTPLKRFSNPGENGNGGRWTRYWRLIHSGAHDRASVGFLSRATAGELVQGRWDTLRIDELQGGIPVLQFSRDAESFNLWWEGTEGWVLESAESVAGPWALESTTPLGIVPQDQSRFFRLAPVLAP